MTATELVLADVGGTNSLVERPARIAELHRRAPGTRNPPLGLAQGAFNGRALRPLCRDAAGVALEPGRVDRKGLAVAQHHGALDDVLQLAHVAGPVVGLK